MQLHRFILTHARFGALALAVSMPLGAQERSSVRINVDAPDSVAHVIDRASPTAARFAIVSRDGTSALLLMDTTIVAQMTDQGLARMNSKEATDTIKGTVNRLFARMALGALLPLFDHGIAYHLRDMKDARYADGRLQLIRANGEEVFRGTEIGKTPLMESFAPRDAIEFARRARDARAELSR
jgi:hypothetical protein